MNDPQDRNRPTDFDAEHAKRDQRIGSDQRREWADGLISCLPDSLGYRTACTPFARLKEQALLNELVEIWNRVNQNSSTNS